MKKLWIINHYAEVPPHGKYTRHFAFAKKLKERGYDVEIFTASTVHNTKVNYIHDNTKVRDEIIDDIPIHFVKTRDYLGNTKGRIWNILDYFFGVLSVTKSYSKPDLVYCSSPHPLNWIAAKRIAKRSGAKFIAETRDLWPETFVEMGMMSRSNPIAMILYGIEKHYYKVADSLIFTFEGGKDYLAKRGIIRDNVHYINNGIDLLEFNRNLIRYPYIDEDLDSDHFFKVTYTGALGQANQVITILEAAKILKQENENIRFYIFGDGYEETALKEYALANHLNNVIFKGKVEKKYMPSILSKSNINIITGKALPMYKYGVSLNKIPEYLASGKPILSNMKVGHDIIIKSHSGLVVSPESAYELSQGIKEFYQMDPDTYEQMCLQAKKTAEQYDFEHLTDLLEGSFK